ncbi:MAG TPA: sulfatase-like hydrolase/transferase [Vicinamibacterales bacterium]|nr:sulfatase-like hydrolase/transferase [Vicinamibacterales bacterium]
MIDSAVSVRSRRVLSGLALVAVLAAAAGCGRGGPSSSSGGSAAGPKPSILLVTLDTTRADAIGPEAHGVETPAFDALAARGVRFRQAYATVPETLPSHASMMTGLYPAGHGIHENGRYLSEKVPVAAEALAKAGYRTAAFVSSFSLARRFGLSRGFAVYDDARPERDVERSARETTDAALAYLAQPGAAGPEFLWVHYNDPHAPYDPPEPFRSQYAGRPYRGEVAAMDQQLGRLLHAFESQVKGPIAIAVVADHGEGLGDHGELQHGLLLYQSTMHVPLVLVGPGIAPRVDDTPVSTRQIFFTLLDWAGLGSAHSLLRPQSREDVVIAEAMKPFLEEGWQPQIMTVDGRQKAIFAGRVEVYDVVADPGETHDLGRSARLAPIVQTTLDEYPVPSPEAARAPDGLSGEARDKLASLGYVSAGAAPVVRKDAPRPADMTALFGLMDEASGLFERAEYARAIPLLQQIIAKDPTNLDATLRLAASHSALGHDAEAMVMFRKAAVLAPKSPDVRMYLGLHYARQREWERAGPLLEQALAGMPNRVPALEALAVVRERQGRPADALVLYQRLYRLRAPDAAEMVHVGELAMAAQQTQAAIDAFERARRLQPAGFAHDLELGVLYLAAHRFAEARDALDRVPSSDPRYPMALFKRAQVSVLLHEPDAPARIALAKEKADATTRPLIASEKLFR